MKNVSVVNIIKSKLDTLAVCFNATVTETVKNFLSLEKLKYQTIFKDILSLTTNYDFL